MPPPGDDPKLTTEIASMRALAKLLGEVPAEAWEAIPALVPEPSRSRAGSGGRRRVWLSRALAAAVCLAVGFAGGTLAERGHGGSTLNPAPRVSTQTAVALRPLAPGPGHSLAVAYMPAPGQVLLRIAQLAPSAPGTYYELWLMSSQQHLTPVAAFRIGAGGRAQLSLRLPDDPRHYRYLDISLQRIGGGTAHSGDSVLRGRLT